MYDELRKPFRSCLAMLLLLASVVLLIVGLVREDGMLIGIGATGVVICGYFSWLFSEVWFRRR
ncbi:MAG: hypothetical protein HS108_15605 [Planctomycetes bacterium]|jgi:preprotein translocase subunit Sss1|nr:hypothetical protein [Planctomycetota bacterium]MCL4731685.1 hypothetical protein [Planctomycetota bacterium]